MKSDMNKRQPKATESRKTTSRKTSPVKAKTATAKKAVAKATPKKLAPKTSAPKAITKPTAKKTKPTTSKAATKSGTTRATAAKTVRKAPTKVVKAAVKPVAAKPVKVVKAPVKTQKETLVSLRTHVDDIVKRLKNADSLTRRSVKSLETSYSVLENEIKTHKTINHAALTRRVDQLSAQLLRNIDATKSEIASDLKAALDSPTITGLQAAIGKSEMRLSQTEIAQSQALAKINRHIAELARVIDSRLKANTQKITTLQDQVSSVETQTEERVVAVEEATATAIRRLGDNVVTAAEQYQNKLDQQNATLREQIANIGLQTSKDFNNYKLETSRRIGNLEGNQKDQNLFMDEAITKLAARIDNLEYGLSDMESNSAQIAQAIPQAVPSQAELVQAPPPAPAHVPAQEDLGDPFLRADQGHASLQEPVAVENPYITLVPDVVQEPTFEDAFSPAPVQVAPAQTYAAPEVQEAQHGSIQPQEYQPQPVQPQMAQQHHYVDPVQASYAAQTQSASASAAYAYDPFAEQNTAYEPAVNVTAQNQDGPLEFIPGQAISHDDLPYADPGYGEQHQAQFTSDGVSRPGHIEPLTEKRPKKISLKNAAALPSIPGLTPRNLKVAGLAVVLATAGYFGIRSFTGGENSAPVSVNNTLPSLGSDVPVTTTIETLDPIGNYEDNQGTPVVPGLETAPPADGAQSLEQAAEGGDAIAQFQLGLQYLDAGRPNDGLKFIRASANQGQPAAQYRLAKLYEAGIGVKADPDMARQLTERAARAGNRIAMHDLGLYYADGLGGVDRDIETALSWFEKAAERGVVDSQYNLGVLFESSPEVPRDALASFVWYSIAASQGDQVAASRKPILEKDLTPEQLEQAKRRLAQFKPTAIDDAANGIFRQVSWTMPEGQSLTAAPELVKDVQSLLGQLGYSVGTPDGSMGPKTRAAVIAFEKANGMAETGVVSASLIDRLQAAAGV